MCVTLGVGADSCLLVVPRQLGRECFVCFNYLDILNGLDAH